MKIHRKTYYYTALFLVALVLIAFAFWVPKGLSTTTFSSKDACFSQVSPKGSFRVDICNPSFPYLSFSKDMPRFVRFYDLQTHQIIGESDILDMSGRGEVFWPLAERLTIIVGGGDNSPEVKVQHLDGEL